MATPVIAHPDFSTLTKILQEDPKQKRKFEDYMDQNTWGSYDTRIVGSWKYNEKEDIVAVELFGEKALSMCIHDLMLKESLGIGPSQYSVFVHRAPAFNSKLKLLLSCLPAEKMFFYPAGVDLRGEFLEEPWLSKVQAISAQPSLTHAQFHDLFCPPSPQMQEKKKRKKVTNIVLGSGR